jgi:hypothetical protein
MWDLYCETSIVNMVTIQINLYERHIKLKIHVGLFMVLDTSYSSKAAMRTGF